MIISENAINFAADGLDGKVSDIQVGFLTEDEELTLSEHVYENMGRPYNIFISEDGLAKRITKKYNKKFSE